jgi:hypothetical protein
MTVMLWICGAVLVAFAVIVVGVLLGIALNEDIEP